VTDAKDNMNNPPWKIPDITVRQALEKADLFTLRTFLRKEAPRNKFLSIKLKTTFIESITLNDGHNKFDALLGELIREDQFGIVILTKREIKLLTDVLASLLALSAKFFTSEALRDDYELLIVILRKLHRYLDKVEEKPVELLQKLGVVYDNLLALLRVDVAPELRDDMFSDGMRLLGRSYYTMHDIERNMIPVLLKAHTVSSQIHAIKKILESKILSQGNKDQILWSTWYGVISDLSKTKTDVVLLHQILTHGEIFQVAKNLKTLGYDDAQSTWLNQFDQHMNLSGPKSLEWDGWRFRSSLRQHDDQGILSSGMRLLLQSEGKEVYREIKAHYRSHNDIIKRLRDSASPALLGEILVFEEEWQELEKMIRAEMDIDLLLTYLPHVCAHSKTAFETVSLVVQHFATHYAGASCRDGLNSVIFRLDDLGYSNLAKRLSDTIDAEFPGRFARSDFALNISC
jgi:hypothetical protein